MKEIVLTKGKVALVDDEDYEMLILLGGRWCVNDGYAYNAKLGRMHRMLLGAKPGVMVDHRNGNKFDNRRQNLRLCTNSQNQANRQVSTGKSKFKGVIWQRRSDSNGFWKAQITVQKKVVYLGSYLTDLDAARAYNVAATEHFGEFAHLNDLTLTPSALTSSERKQVKRTSPSGFKGVTFDSNRGKWAAQLIFKGVSYLRKRFDTAEAAARAYDITAREVHGTNAITNF